MTRSLLTAVCWPPRSSPAAAPTTPLRGAGGAPRGRRVPGDRRAQVRHHDGPGATGADRGRRVDRAGHGARARAQADRHDRVVRRSARRRVAVGAGRARRREADRAEQRGRLPVREDRRAPARPDHRDQRGDAARRLREAVEARADDPRGQGQHGLLLAVGRPDRADRSRRSASRPRARRSSSTSRTATRRSPRSTRSSRARRRRSARTASTTG